MSYESQLLLALVKIKWYGCNIRRARDKYLFIKCLQYVGLI